MCSEWLFDFDKSALIRVKLMNLQIIASEDVLFERAFWLS